MGGGGVGGWAKLYKRVYAMKSACRIIAYSEQTDEQMQMTLLGSCIIKPNGVSDGWAAKMGVHAIQFTDVHKYVLTT